MSDPRATTTPRHRAEPGGRAWTRRAVALAVFLAVGSLPAALDTGASLVVVLALATSAALVAFRATGVLTGPRSATATGGPE